ncbi:MAG TPA: adenylate/guanylate cyclase domain-containing protein [Gaiellaceae bacterium]|nr:adenylate/guanylate cyclase domain-containing protein [Gaiellaceae bacterium]
MEIADVRYTRSGDLSIAYQVLGHGPVDLVFVPFFLSTVFARYVPLVADFFDRLAVFSRLILFDKRGTGASDRPRTPPTLESQMDDVRAVLDAVGSERAALFGAGHGGQMCALFAATYPDRTSALILYNTWARLPGTPEEHLELVRTTRERFGLRETIEQTLRNEYASVGVDESFLYWSAMAVRASGSPSAAANFTRTLIEADITDVLPAIRVPTLVLYPRLAVEPAPDDAQRIAFVGIEDESRRLAAAIPDARTIGIAGQDRSPFVGTEVTDEVERFLSAPRERAVPDRVLATVLFTDIVGSTERAVALGDRRWRELLAAHRADVRRELRRFAGEELDTAGDGFFASFDGPARGLNCAQAIVASAAEHGLEVRAGLHAGECDREGGKLTGIAVHIGARIAALAQPGEVLVSRTVKDLVAGSGIEFDDRGEQELKGVPGDWRLYAVRDG